jgi:hypothetical protein
MNSTVQPFAEETTTFWAVERTGSIFGPGDSLEQDAAITGSTAIAKSAMFLNGRFRIAPA